MNFIEKRTAKKLATIGFFIAYTMMGFLMGCFVLWIALNFMKENTSVISNAMIGYFALVFFLVMIAFVIIGQTNLNKRWKYKKDLIRWQQYTYFNKCLNALLEGDYDTAVKYHDHRLLKDQYLRDFLWGFGIHTFLTGKVAKRKEFAEQVIENLKTDFNPDKIFAS